MSLFLRETQANIHILIVWDRKVCYFRDNWRKREFPVNEKVCNNIITKDPTTPQMCHYTTL